MSEHTRTYCMAKGHRAHACPKRMHVSLFVGLLALAPALASAEILGTASTAEGTIELHSAAGVCVGRALTAAWVSNDQQTRVPGCWKLAGENAHVVFFDGDVARIPLNLIKKPEAL